jgi:CBS domain-containing protein
VSGILIGCSYGRLFGLFVETYITKDIKTTSYAVVGAASVLSGYARHTFSLAVIMMESTENVDLFVPIVFAILVAYVVGGIFTRSIYINSVRFKNIPFLIEHIPDGVHYVKAEDIMKRNVKSFPMKVEVREIGDTLKQTNYSGFPVVNNHKRLVGIINRDYLMVLLRQKCWTGDFRQTKDVGNHRVSNRGSLNSDFKETPLGRVSVDASAKRKLIMSQVEGEDERPDIPMHEIIDSLPVTWEDFNVKFNDEFAKFDEQVREIVDDFGDKKIDLRPYMLHSPHFVSPRDGL